jgi:hypothetical protein
MPLKNKGGNAISGEDQDREVDPTLASETTQSALDDLHSRTDELVEGIEREQERKEFLKQQEGTPYASGWDDVAEAQSSTDEQSQSAGAGSAGAEIGEIDQSTRPRDADIEPRSGSENTHSQQETGVGGWEPTEREASIKKEFASETVSQSESESKVNNEGATGQSEAQLSGQDYQTLKRVESSDGAITTRVSVDVPRAVGTHGQTDTGEMVASRGRMRSQEGENYQGTSPRQGTWADDAGDGEAAGRGTPLLESASASVGSGVQDQLFEGDETVTLEGEHTTQRFDRSSTPEVVEEQRKGEFREFEDLQKSAVEEESRRRDADSVERGQESRTSVEQSIDHPDVENHRHFDGIPSLDEYEEYLNKVKAPEEVIKFRTALGQHEMDTDLTKDPLQLEAVGSQAARNLGRETDLRTIEDMAGMTKEDFQEVSGIGEQKAEALAEVAEDVTEIESRIQDQTERIIEEYREGGLGEDGISSLPGVEGNPSTQDVEQYIRENARAGRPPEITADCILTEEGREMLSQDLQSHYDPEVQSIQELTPFTQDVEHPGVGLGPGNTTQETVPYGNATVEGRVVEIVEADTVENMPGEQYQIAYVRDGAGDVTAVTFWKDSYEYPDSETELDNRGLYEDLAAEGMHPDEDVVTVGDKVRLQNVQVNQHNGWSKQQLENGEIDGHTLSSVPETELIFQEQSPVPRGAAETTDPPETPSYPDPYTEFNSPTRLDSAGQPDDGQRSADSTEDWEYFGDDDKPTGKDAGGDDN